jgi:hypothetical protein
VSKQYTFTTKDVQAVAQFSNHDGPHGPCQWSPPKAVTLRVVSRNEALKYGRITEPAGAIIQISVMDFDWAEYRGVADWDSEFKEFMAEEYRMRILSGWTPEGICG